MANLQRIICANNTPPSPLSLNINLVLKVELKKLLHQKFCLPTYNHQYHWTRICSTSFSFQRIFLTCRILFSNTSAAPSESNCGSPWKYNFLPKHTSLVGKHEKQVNSGSNRQTQPVCNLSHLAYKPEISTEIIHDVELPFTTAHVRILLRYVLSLEQLLPNVSTNLQPFK